MSAFHPIADIPQRRLDVRFGPNSDIAPTYSITSSAIESIPEGTSIPSMRAV